MGIFQKLGWIDYFQKLDGFDEEITMAFAANLKENDEKSITKERGLKIKLTEETMILVIGIRKVKRWDKHGRESTGRDKNKNF